jgi:ABC-type multidrug transport system ATPase subunit
LRWRIPDANPQQKAIELRLGQWKRPREVLRILGGYDEEGIRKRKSLPVEGDLTFVHRLEKRRLGTGAGAVDLVGEKNVGEDRPLPENELAAPLIVNADPENIGRKKVARELDAPELSANGFCERTCQSGLSHPGYVLDEQVSPRQERDQCELDGLLLTLQSPPDRLTQRLERRQLLGDAGGNGQHTNQISTVGMARRASPGRTVCTRVARGAKIGAPQNGFSSTVITLENVRKTYGPVRALAGVSLTFESGRVSVLYGANGSGKSTVLAIVGTLARATSGRVSHGELGRTRAEVRRTLGWVGHDSLCYPDLTGLENIELTARLQGSAEPAHAVALVRERFELGQFVMRPMRTFSRGQKQRVALARALVHRPRLLLLDEPTSGLDTAATERLARVVREEAARSVIVVVVTHDLLFAEAIGGSVTTLDRGQVAATAMKSS